MIRGCASPPAALRESHFHFDTLLTVSKLSKGLLLPIFRQASPANFDTFAANREILCETMTNLEARRNTIIPYSKTPLFRHCFIPPLHDPLNEGSERRKVTVSFARSWKATEGYGWLWKAMEGYGRFPRRGAGHRLTWLFRISGFVTSDLTRFLQKLLAAKYLT